MYVSEINARDYRCFRDLQLSLHPSMTVIVGDNGRGKSTVLSILAALCERWIASQTLPGYCGPLYQVDDWTCTGILRWEQPVGDVEGIRPVICCYGTDRLHRTAWPDIIFSGLKMYGDGTVLQAGITADSLADWMQKGGLVHAHEDAVKQAVAAVLAPHGWRNLRWERGSRGLTLDHPDQGRISVNQLSNGIRSLLALVGDIALRCVYLNPELGVQAATKSPGLIMIDEVELHLHPRGQQQILGSLQAAFPSIQFVVTTNSPQVVSTVAAANVRMLVGGEKGDTVVVQPAQSPLGRSVATILPDVFDVSPEPAIPIVGVLLRYELWVRQGLEEEETVKNLRRQLDDAGVDISPEDLELWRLLAGANIETA